MKAPYIIALNKHGRPFATLHLDTPLLIGSNQECRVRFRMIKVPVCCKIFISKDKEVH